MLSNTKCDTVQNRHEVFKSLVNVTDSHKKTSNNLDKVSYMYMYGTCVIMQYETKVACISFFKPDLQIKIDQ